MRRFSELEAAVMESLWSRTDSVSGAQVFDELGAERQIAYTTVMRTLDTLHRMGWLTRQRSGRAFVYRPTLTRAQYSARVMRHALGKGGQPELVLTHFLEQMTEDDTAALHAALRRLASGRESE
ncbi:BlaI/MecI/CopY family transcriptional regulator [Rhodococcus oxybenzonivorans]|uniref:BlaI/MecI/CopY family transcriptional regulator n=1 Tax=Rhodococcus oxybenzonivorans TaxID=1990687 RepID=UPI001E433AB5|nr:BlaI/MecI/CopY family transcriptional regulator [Rhodococcus oxybenzonivorans]